MNEKVSVIIPLYNSAKYMKKSVESVISQTYTNLDIYLIDDCSKDSTKEIAQEYVNKYSNVFYYRLENNSGAAVARNKGMELSDSRYIAFLDSDDYWSSDKLEKQMNLLHAKNAGFVFCSYDVVDGNNSQIKAPLRIKSIVKYRDLLTKTMIATPTVLIDRAIVGKLSMPLRRTGQDYAFWLLLLRNNDAYGIKEALAHVCRRSGSLSKNKLQNIKDVWEVQTINEKINPILAAFNVFLYCAYTLKKHFF